MNLPKISHLLGILLFSGIALLPVYVFASGGIQPSHIVLFTFSALGLSLYGYRPEPWSLLLLLLTIYVFLVEAFYTVKSHSLGNLWVPAFFLFNFITSQVIFVHIRNNGLKSTTLGVIFAATVGTISAVSSGVDLSSLNGEGRETGSFNNPNQLGFFSVCLLSFAYLLYASGSLRYWQAASLLGCAIFLSILSLSKAAMVANFLVTFIALKPEFSKRVLFFWVAGIVLTSFALAWMFQAGYLGDQLFVKRLQSITTESDSSLASRGYFAFLESNFFELLFGLGAANVKLMTGHEVHSTLASVFNNYGFLGFAIFIMILMMWAMQVYRGLGVTGFIAILGPSMLYGITHNGTRFAFFWVLFAASMAVTNRTILERHHLKTARNAITKPSDLGNER